MNVLILGHGPEELEWASWFADRPEHHLIALSPGPPEEFLADVPVARDLDEALAMPGVELVVVGGPLEFRGEALRRAAAEGLSIICLHPPGEDSESYYQVSLSRAETGAVVVPDLPLRLHPGVARLKQALLASELGPLRGIRLECSSGPDGDDLVRVTFARMVDVVRFLLGEVETVSASGDPPGEHPDVELVVQLRAAEGRRAEIRASTGPEESVRLTLTGAGGSLTLEFDRDLRSPARLLRRPGNGSDPEHVETLDSWDPHGAILEFLRDASAAGAHDPSAMPPSAGPSLLDGTRAMELSEAVARSLRRGRTIDLHYESITEEASFKSIMTSTGCLLLLCSLMLLPVALAGPALGIPWTIYLAYAIPPVLVLFVGSQILRFGIRRDGRTRPPRTPASGDPSRLKSHSSGRHLDG